MGRFPVYIPTGHTPVPLLTGTINTFVAIQPWTNDTRIRILAPNKNMQQQIPSRNFHLLKQSNHHCHHWNSENNILQTLGSSNFLREYLKKTSSNTHRMNGTGIFTYIYGKFKPNVGEYTIPGSYGITFFEQFTNQTGCSYPWAYKSDVISIKFSVKSNHPPFYHNASSGLVLQMDYLRVKIDYSADF